MWRLSLGSFLNIRCPTRTTRTFPLFADTPLFRSPGTNAEYHLVDERIAGLKPQSLDFPAAAALPLTAITAWEMLFHRFGLTRDSRGSILIVGGDRKSTRLNSSH